MHIPGSDATVGNVVFQIERLHDPTDPSTAHVQHDDVPRALDPVEDEGEFRQHDDMAMVMNLLVHCFA